MHGYYRLKLRINHFWKLKEQGDAVEFLNDLALIFKLVINLLSS